jgi:alkylhydroperoxidase family enzyme
LGSEDWKALKNPASSSFFPKEKAALAFAEKLTRKPQDVKDADIAALKKHFDDGEIVELTVLVGLINLTNRFTDPLGMDLEIPAVKLE